jgi:hypothetical protein
VASALQPNETRAGVMVKLRALVAKHGMNADEIVAKTRSLLDEVGQLKSPTPRVGSPKVQGWLLGWIVAHASDDAFAPASLLEQPAVHEAMTKLFEGVPNPFGNFGGSLGYTSLVETERILKKLAAGEALEAMEETREEWLAVGHAEGRASIVDGAPPARFLAIFGR